MSIDAQVSEYTETPSWVTYLDKSKEGEPIPTTISAFMMKVGIIDCDPIGQRLDVGSLEKKQGIIVAILTGQDICEIALRHMDRSKSDVTHEYRSIGASFQYSGLSSPFVLVVILHNLCYQRIF